MYYKQGWKVKHNSSKCNNNGTNRDVKYGVELLASVFEYTLVHITLTHWIITL